MRRIFSFFTALFLMSGFLIPIPVVAGDGSVLDQSYQVTTDNGYTAVGIAGSGQSFRPTKNRITAVEVSFSNRQTNSSITMTIKNAMTDQVIGSETHTLTFAGDTAWETFTFAPNLVVVPEGRYKMELTSNIDNQTRWLSSHNAPVYARGTAIVAGTSQDFDMLFRQYGKDVTETPATDNTGTTDTATTTGSGAAATKYGDISVDSSIKTPILTAISKNGVTKKAPITETITVGLHDKLILNGTSFEGAKVVLFLGDKAYDALMAKDGTWTAELVGSKLLTEEVTIKGQAIKDTKGSEKTDFFKIKVLGAKTATTTEDKNWFSGWNIFFVLTSVGILLLVLLLLALIARRHHQEKMNADNNKSNKKEKKSIFKKEGK